MGTGSESVVGDGVRTVSPGMLGAFNKFVFPLASLVLISMICSTAVVVFLVSTPFKQGVPPALPADVTDEYRIYSFYKRDMYDLYIQSENKPLSVHVLQVGVGMVLGLLCVFVGTAMCWFGVTGAVTLEASDGTKKFNFQSAQVGVVLLIGGIILVSISVLTQNQSVNGGDLNAAAPQAHRNLMLGTSRWGAGFSEEPPPMTKREAELRQRRMPGEEKGGGAR
jgi:hypothetical protein